MTEEIKIIFNDETSIGVTVEEGMTYSATGLIPLLESQVSEEQKHLLDTFKYNLDACGRGDIRLLHDYTTSSIHTEDVAGGETIAFASTHKNGQ